MRAKKTMSVKDLLEKVNGVIRWSICDPLGRQGMISVLNSVLHDTGNYKGFRYLEEGEIPVGQRPGIRWVDTGEGLTASFENTDATRVAYFSN